MFIFFLHTYTTQLQHFNLSYLIVLRKKDTLSDSCSQVVFIANFISPHLTIHKFSKTFTTSPLKFLHQNYLSKKWKIFFEGWEKVENTQQLASNNRNL